MSEYPAITHILRTVYNAEDGLSEAAALRLYRRAADSGDNRARLESELREAFERQDVSWRAMLCNDAYEVVAFDSEEEARAHARKILWDPLFDEA